MIKDRIRRIVVRYNLSTFNPNYQANVNNVVKAIDRLCKKTAMEAVAKARREARSKKR